MCGAPGSISPAKRIKSMAKTAGAKKSSFKRAPKRKNTRRRSGRDFPSNIDLNFRPVWRVDSVFDYSEKNEVRIACIGIESTLSDETCVFARRDKDKIHYKVYDEYDGGTISGRKICSSKRPLTLGKLTDFFLGAWDLFKVLEMNFAEDGYPPEKVRAFVEASSEFYPDFGKLIGQRVEKWLCQQRSRWGIPFDVPRTAFDQLIENLDALYQALDLATVVESSEKNVEALTAVSLQIQHLYGHKKKIIGQWSAIFQKIEASD